MLTAAFLFFMAVTSSSCFFYFSFWGKGGEISLLFDNNIVGLMSMVMFISRYIIFLSSGFSGVNNIYFAKIIFIFNLAIFIYIISGGLFSLSFGWEFLGVISFLLILCYVEHTYVEQASIVFFVNRIRDGLLLTILVFLVFSTHCLYFNGVWGSSAIFSLFFFKFYFLFFLISGVKTPQIPLGTWLLSAIYAPTPVSALVHSSTLVIAGLLLLIKIWESVQIGEYRLSLAKIWRVVSLLTGLIIASFQKDLKKIIAISTLIHIVLVFFLLVSSPSSSMSQRLIIVHLIAHGVAKSRLFMLGGVIFNKDRIRQGCFFLRSCRYNNNTSVVSWGALLKGNLYEIFFFGVLVTLGGLSLALILTGNKISALGRVIIGFSSWFCCILPILQEFIIYYLYLKIGFNSLRIEYGNSWTGFRDAATLPRRKVLLYYSLFAIFWATSKAIGGLSFIFLTTQLAVFFFFSVLIVILNIFFKESFLRFFLIRNYFEFFLSFRELAKALLNSLEFLAYWLKEGFDKSVSESFFTRFFIHAKRFSPQRWWAGGLKTRKGTIAISLAWAFLLVLLL